MARVSIYCGSRSKIEAIVGWQNISLCPVILVISSFQGYSYSTRSQSHFTSSILFNLDRLHSFWDCGITLQTRLPCQNHNNHECLIPEKIYPPVGQYRAGEMNSSFACGRSNALNFRLRMVWSVIEIYEVWTGSFWEVWSTVGYHWKSTCSN